MTNLLLIPLVSAKLTGTGKSDNQESSQAALGDSGGPADLPRWEKTV